MEIQQIRGFHAVARCKNFTKAAKSIRRTQPTVSLQVKSLEEELGVKLLERLGSKEVKLTAEGRLFLEISQPVVETFESLPQRFSEARDLYSHSSLTVLSHRSVMTYVLPDVVQKFRQKFPECRLCILNRTREQIIEMLANGDADMAITSLEPEPPGLNYETLAKFNRILIGPRKHPLEEKTSITLKDIASSPLILPALGSNTRKRIDLAFQNKQLQYQLAMEVVGRDAIKIYAGMGMGLSIMNEYYVSEEDKKRLFVKDVTKFFGSAETGIATRKGRELSKPADFFVKLVKKQVKQ